MEKRNCLLAYIVLALALAGAAPGRAAEEHPFRNPALPVEQRVADLVSRLTLEEKISLMNSDAAAVERLGIKAYKYGSEALHGIMGPGNFTVFPQAIALAASWNPDLVHEVTTAISDEAWGAINRDIPKEGYPGARFLSFWSPNINMARDPRWGRTPETYGEDPFLTSRIGLAFVTGLQGDDPKYVKVVASPKHYAANNEEHNRFRCNAKISERTLREYYFPGFRTAVVEGRAQSVMSAYNAVNGVPCSANPWLLTDVLRKDWGFDGYVVTDCGAPSLLMEQHKYVKTGGEAAAAAVKAGVDIECGGERILPKYLNGAVQKGVLSGADIDRAVSSLMRVRMRLGMFDPPEMNPYSKISPDVIASDAHSELARKASRESIVLLKNEPAAGGKKLLPLDTNGIKTIAVIGPNANVVTFGDYTGTPAREPVTPFEGIKARAGAGVSVRTAEWIPAPKEEEYEVMNGGSGLFPKDSPQAKGGLRAAYYDNQDFSGEPVESGFQDEMMFTKDNVPENVKRTGKFAVRWYGDFIPENSGVHVFSVTAQGRARLLLDGKEVLVHQPLAKKEKPKIEPGKPMSSWMLDNQWNKRVTGTVMLEAGKKYDIVLEYAPGKGQPQCRLEWVPPKGGAIETRKQELDIVKHSDLVIAVMGYYRVHEHESIDRVSLDLPDGQDDYIKAVIEHNKNVVFVLVNGSPVAINKVNATIPAVVDLWYPGERGGDALADVLFGDFNPAGRLPFTFYKSADDLPPFDDYEVSKGRTYMYFEGEPIYPFGYGLSYTAFEYSDLKIDRKTAAAGDVLNVSFTVKNTGGADGDEVAQLYVRDVESAVKRPKKKLSGFRRVHVKKGESVTVKIELPVERLSYWDEAAKQFAVEPGEFEIQVGASSADIRLKDMIVVQ